MKEENLNQVEELFNYYRTTEDYKARKAQFAVAEVNKAIIVETLKIEPIQNEHLTGLIQMFKYGCSDKTFLRYLTQNVADVKKRSIILAKNIDVNEWGYTGAGKNSISGLTQAQLQTTKTFLLDALKIDSIEEAIAHCQRFDSQNIPLVKSGIYSPWLYYINPEIFPILNNTHKQFRNWIGMTADYPSCIRDFARIKTLVKEPELGTIDFFCHLFLKYYDAKTNPLRKLNLAGKRIYKMSHGIFKSNVKYRKNALSGIMENNNWICLEAFTGKNQGENFRTQANIGDYVYVCYGGQGLYCIAKIISDSEYLDHETDDLIAGDRKWVFREIEPLFWPVNANTQDLKNDSSQVLPSGNSTFWEIKADKLANANRKLFLPKFNLEIINDKSESENQENQSESEENEIQPNMPLNTILFGPPGTGKTYTTLDKALEILEEGEPESREAGKATFSKYQAEGRIYFTTFHQNMAYEDFIEGIKPMEPDEEEDFLKYEIQDGLFMKACIEATYSYLLGKNQISRAQIQSFLDYNSLFDILFDKVSEAGNLNLTTKSDGQVTATITTQGNFAIRHEGKEKPYSVSRERLAVLYEAFPDPAKITNITNEFRKAIGGCNSTAYWSVLNAIVKIKAETKKGNNQSEVEALDTNPGYDQKKAIVKKYWKTRDTLPMSGAKLEPFVFIIDEINRGNVSQIFGELITLIEDDKRIGKPEVLFIDLPYSKHPFAVPPNLHIIGTMNTADRSVEALDTALRRRFVFEPKMPEPDKLASTEDGIDLPAMLSTLNNRLRILKDSDHTIGHAWLWDIKNVEDLKAIFGNKILPLLQEYFYNDYEKLGLVLGDAFFQLPHKRVAANEFAAFSGNNGLAGQYRNKFIFQLKPVEELGLDDFLSLCKLVVENEVE